MTTNPHSDNKMMVRLPFPSLGGFTSLLTNVGSSEGKDTNTHKYDHIAINQKSNRRIFQNRSKFSVKIE